MSVYSGGRGAGAFSEVDAGAGGVFWGAGVDLELYVESFYPCASLRALQLAFGVETTADAVTR